MRTRPDDRQDRPDDHAASVDAWRQRHDRVAAERDRSEQPEHQPEPQRRRRLHVRHGDECRDVHASGRPISISPRYWAMEHEVTKAGTGEVITVPDEPDPINGRTLPYLVVQVLADLGGN
jgi:hypothetical protein